MRARARQAFEEVEEWIFDLDNTLYPAHLDLFSEIDRRMTAFIAEFLSLTPDRARALQKQYYRDHGTTLRGLMDRHGLDPEPFLAHVHAIDLARLHPEPALARALARLPGRRIVYTNGSEAHARAVLAARGLGGLFGEIVDITRARYEPKPWAGPLDRLVADLGIAPARAAMFEDIARNLVHPHALGMRTVLVRSDRHPDAGDLYQHHEPADLPPHVHFVTDDLTGFLEEIAG
ncbi:MAG: pyrimidine 5'-nucleotidase [Alphaproteobacteria bacterium]|nr:pyrimidine 5'-nucleotidase [Alphaproteobacteria bacterium]